MADRFTPEQLEASRAYYVDGVLPDPSLGFALPPSALPGFVSTPLDELTDDALAEAFRGQAARDQAAMEQVRLAIQNAVEATQEEVERLWSLMPPEAAAGMRATLGEDGDMDATTLCVMLRVAIAVHRETGLDGDALAAVIDERMETVQPGRLDLLAPGYWEV